MSFHKHRRSSSEGQLVQNQDQGKDKDSIDPRPRSSFDTFLIPHRTRYPSDQARISEPSAIDLHIAASLLSKTHSEPGQSLRPLRLRGCCILTSTSLQRIRSPTQAFHSKRSPRYNNYISIRRKATMQLQSNMALQNLRHEILSALSQDKMVQVHRQTHQRSRRQRRLFSSAYRENIVLVQ